MTKKIKVELPELGEGVIEATITRWLAELNTKITEDEPLVEIATDKVDSEIPAPASGILVKTFFDEGETPKIGDVIAVILTESSDEQSTDFDDDFEEKQNAVEMEQAETSTLKSNRELVVKYNTNGQVLIPPFIRHYASQRGISFEELQLIQGTGSEGILTKEDIRNYFKNDKVVNGIHINNVTPRKPLETPKIEYVPKEGEELVEIDRTRKIIAEHMVKSLQVAPHVTSTVEVDVTELVNWRNRNKTSFKTVNGVNLTYTSLIVLQVIRALKEYSGINVSLFGDKLIKKKYINIGIATALPNGNLVVPVLKNADQKNLVKLALELNEQTERARNNKLKPGETTGGTFTITNMGQFNNIFGTPIINQPESAILAVGAIKKRPWIVDLDGAQTIGIRDILTLSLSYDHRIIDGALGGSFLNRIGELLENNLPLL